MQPATKKPPSARKGALLLGPGGNYADFRSPFVLLALTRLAIFLLISLAIALLIALALLALLVLVALRGVVRVGLLSGLFCTHRSPFISSIGRTGLPEIIAGCLSPPWSIRYASLNSKCRS